MESGECRGVHLLREIEIVAVTLKESAFVDILVAGLKSPEVGGEKQAYAPEGVIVAKRH